MNQNAQKLIKSWGIWEVNYNESDLKVNGEMVKELLFNLIISPGITYVDCIK